MSPALASGALAAVATAAVLAVAVGVHVATWGAYKDAPYEGYHPPRQLRTLLLAAAAALGVVAVGGAGAVLPALGVVYALERLATEWWKAIVRSDDQAAYAIPMRLGFRGRPVDAGGLRWAVGLGIAVGLVLVGIAIHVLQQHLGGVPGWAAALSVGGLGGWFTAFGGAWKDAPVEGFSGWKFVRSPAVATAWALPLSLLTHDWVVLGLGAAGMAVASIETYKTFLTGGRAPGKFEGRPVRWTGPRIRRRIGRVHALGWGLFGLVALVQAEHAAGAGATAGGPVAAAVAVLCLAAALVVLRTNRRLAHLSLPAAPAQERMPARSGV